MTPEPLRVAIVGAGPRALGAAEALGGLAAEQAARVEIDLYDPGAAPGAGPNFDPGQTPLCLLNIPLRAVDLPVPDWLENGPGPFRDWLPEDRRNPDRFPPRAEIGAWLAQRFAALVEGPPEGVVLRHLRSRVARIAPASAGWTLEVEGAGERRYEHVLLAPGQPATEPDPQLARWIAHAGGGEAVLASAGDPDALLAAAAGWRGRTVAIRGLALSTFDVLRLLTLGTGGTFDGDSYRPSGREPARIVPFSRDGLPPWPKPQSGALDSRFDPLPEETAAFAEAMQAALGLPPDAAVERVCEALVAPARRILHGFGGEAGAGEIGEWLACERKSPGAQEGREAPEMLDHAIAVAEGDAVPGVGYAIGQIWRKWQSELRRAFNPAKLAPETASALIGFDEGLKRFSYGPPVSAARELRALIASGLVTLRAAEDPAVETVPGGWLLTEGGDRLEAGVMIDAVSPPPKIDALADPLLAGLREEGRLTAVPESGGARTDARGRLIDGNGQAQPGLALLGRLALGSVIAADSLHDCLGEAATRWARGVLEGAASPR